MKGLVACRRALLNSVVYNTCIAIPILRLGIARVDSPVVESIGAGVSSLRLCIA